MSARECGSPEPQSIATVAHEMGHILGLGDFYHGVDGIEPGQRRWLFGCFSLMSGGAWGCGRGDAFGTVRRPVSMGAFERWWLGWAEETTARSGWRHEYVLPPVQSTGRILRVPTNVTGEWLHLEYRPATGFDADLPAGGVLVYHITQGIGYPCATCPRIYPYMLEEADDDSALVRTHAEGGNRGVAGDVFVKGRRWVLNDDSHPSIRSTRGFDTNVTVEIEVGEDNARVWVSTRPLLDTDGLVDQLFGTRADALSVTDVAALDADGNGNGRLDLGDARAYLLKFPSSPNN